MPGERQPQRGRVDVDHTAPGIFDEHGLAEAQRPRDRLPSGLAGDGGPVAYDSEFVAVVAAGIAEDPQDVVTHHTGSQPGGAWGAPGGPGYDAPRTSTDEEVGSDGSAAQLCVRRMARPDG
jgi:hypothetical protein